MTRPTDESPTQPDAAAAGDGPDVGPSFEETAAWQPPTASGPAPAPESTRFAVSSTTDDTPSMRVALVPGDAPGLATETELLLAGRLRAVFLLLLIAFTLFFARNLFLEIHDRLLQVLHAGLIVLLAVGYAWLGRRPRQTLAGLRAVELATFGIILAFFVLLQFRSMVRYFEAQDAMEAVLTMKSISFEMFMLIVLYGLFIPNTWQRAAWVVIPLALAAPVTSIAVHLTHPQFHAFTRQVATFERVTDNALLLLIGSITALYGTHVINRLRTAVREAKEFGQYQLGRLLGQGGMGDVHLAEHRLLKRPCAIKRIRPEAAGDPKALARFAREVRATARLTHPNTVEIYDYGRAEDGSFYYVMEYLRGLSLAELVRRHGPLPPGRVIHLLRQACGALSEAHAVGLIHRDLKPANIFAARRGGLHDFAKLLDFGLVKPVLPDPENLDLSHDGTVSGSPLYMSPEQATAAGPLDPRTDLYAMGAVAYFLLVGRPPFAGATAMAVMIAHARDEVQRPSLARPDLRIPADLEAVVLRCLSKDPEARYQDADSLEAALAACACAADWDNRRAAEWWRQREPASEPATPGPVPAATG